MRACACVCVCVWKKVLHQNPFRLQIDDVQLPLVCISHCEGHTHNQCPHRGRALSESKPKYFITQKERRNSSSKGEHVSITALILSE